jgi:hypothetical protein
MKRAIAFLSLFTSLSTIFCCALPALFVVLGMGAAFAGLVGAVPQLVLLSEHKILVFGLGGILLALGGLLQLRSRSGLCPVDPALGQACATTRDWSRFVYFVALGLYSIGSFFAFLAPLLF